MLRHIINRQYDPVSSNVLYPLAKGNECLLQRMSLLQSMEVHRGCVNTVVWDTPGNLLLSGSDDQQLVICDPWERMTKMRIHTAHRANIFSAKFMPHTANKKIVSCSGDGIVIYTDVEKQEETHDCKFTCHYSTCYDVVTLPDDPHTFLTCGEDDCVRWFDLRIKTKCSVRECQEDILLNMGRPVTAVAVNPITPYHLAVATQDSTIRVYDRRILGTRASDSYLEQADRALLMRLKPDSMEGKSHRVTSLRYSQDGQEILASYSSDFLYLFDTQNYKETSMKVKVDNDGEANSGPTLKRLRLRGDWSDTGPQALPEREMRSQTGDVGQARPTLHATLMQRMTDVLSRMLNDPSSRASAQRTTSESESSQNQLMPDAAADEEGNTESGCQPQSSSPSVHLASSSLPCETPDTVAEENTETEQSPTASGATHQSEELGERNCDEPELDTMQSGQIACQPDSESQEPVSGSPLTEAIESASSVVDGMNHENETPTRNSNIEGLQDRITSLRRGFVEKHQVEPSVNLSYSGHGVSSSMISLGVGDEVSRGCDSQENEEETSSSPTEPSPRLQPEQDQNPEPPESSETALSEPPDSTSSPSPSTSSHPPVTKAQTISTSNSSPAICNMEAEPSSGWTARGGLGPDSDFGDDDSDDESTSARTASARMANAIERAVQRARGERASGGGEESEVTVPQAAVRQCYKGHRNARTMIKEACFWGDTHVMSGSDCGRVFVWERNTGRLVMLWEADRHVVNCLQPHPTLPVLATSGIDYDVKLWAPLCEESRFDEAKAKEITQRNEALLEETRDTITVPATFMIRMLASLNQLRRGTTFAERWRNRRQARRQGEEEDQGGSNE